MSKYKIGQWVRIEFKGGYVIEGPLTKCRCCDIPVLAIEGVGETGCRFWTEPGYASRRATVTVIPPPEPTGLGAVVRARSAYREAGPWVWVRRSHCQPEGHTFPWVALESPGTVYAAWCDFEDPEILTEGIPQ